MIDTDGKPREDTFYFDGDLDVKTAPGFVAPTTVSHENENWAEWIG